MFAASPCPADCPGRYDRDGNHVPHRGGPGQYHLPRHWEKTVPSEVWLDEKYQPGWALAAVGGHACDFLDVDPRNGGNASIAELDAAGHSPLTFGTQLTPSGGEHYIVAPTGIRKAGGDRSFMPGLDLQAGDENGLGRGFVWIAPTVRPSKDPADAGALKAYRWEVAPDLEALDDMGQSARDSMRPIIDRIEAKRSAVAPRESAPREPIDAHAVADPFLDASMASRHHSADRAFTMTEAQDFVRPCLIELRQASIGSIEETANVAAATLSHFVPAFWSVDTAMALIEDALSHTAYDPNGPSDWTAEKFRAVLDGRRPPLDPWKASQRAEAPTPPEVTVEAETPEEESLTVLEKLRRKLISAEDLSRRPPPEALIEGLLNCNTEAWMIGAPGSLKSFVALDLAGAVGAGRAWHGRRVKQAPVLYVAAEGETGMTLRTRAYIAHHGSMPGVTFLPYPVQVKSNDGQWVALAEIVKEIQPGLIILDTQHRVSIGIEENSSTEFGIVLSAITRLRRPSGACILTIHHTGRNGKDARGSSAIDGAQDTELKIVRAEPRSSLQCRIVQDKQKDMSEGDGAGIPLQLLRVALGQDEHGAALSSLVVSTEADPFKAGEGFTAADAEPWRGQTFGEWTAIPGQVDHRRVTARQILQALADHAGKDGLTEAGIRRIITERWGPCTDTTFMDNMSIVKDLGDLVVNVGGRRWTLDDVELKRLRGDAP